MKGKWPVRALLVLLCIAMLCNIPAYAAEARADDRIYHNATSLSKKSNDDLRRSEHLLFRAGHPCHGEDWCQQRGNSA